MQHAEPTHIRCALAASGALGSMNQSPSNPAAAVPKMIARNVVITMMPLARGRSSVRSISGRMPYFGGPKNALCVPIRNSTANSPV